MFGGFNFGGLGGHHHQESQQIEDDQQNEQQVDNNKYYQILQCTKNASQQQIKKKYKDLAKSIIPIEKVEMLKNSNNYHKLIKLQVIHKKGKCMINMDQKVHKVLVKVNMTYQICFSVEEEEEKVLICS